MKLLEIRYFESKLSENSLKLDLSLLFRFLFKILLNFIRR